MPNAKRIPDSPQLIFLLFVPTSGRGLVDEKGSLQMASPSITAPTPTFIIITSTGTPAIPESEVKALRNQYPGCTIEVIPTDSLPDNFTNPEIGGSF